MRVSLTITQIGPLMTFFACSRRSSETWLPLHMTSHTRPRIYSCICECPLPLSVLRLHYTIFKRNYCISTKHSWYRRNKKGGVIPQPWEPSCKSLRYTTLLHAFLYLSDVSRSNLGAYSHPWLQIKAGMRRYETNEHLERPTGAYIDLVLYMDRAHTTANPRLSSDTFLLLIALPPHAFIHTFFARTFLHTEVSTIESLAQSRLPAKLSC
jgi:hypothetical protein